MDLITGLALVAASQALIAGTVVVADLIPAAPREPAHRETAETTGAFPIIGGVPRNRRDPVVIEIDDRIDRALRTRGAHEAFVRRGESLRHKVSVLGAAYREAQEQLEAYEAAGATGPTPMPTGGER